MTKLMTNSTTNLPGEHTMAEIQQLLVHHGARGLALADEARGTVRESVCTIMRNGKALPFRRRAAWPARTADPHVVNAAQRWSGLHSAHAQGSNGGAGPSLTRVAVGDGSTRGHPALTA
jgi:hypothetical protein